MITKRLVRNYLHAIKDKNNDHCAFCSNKVSKLLDEVQCGEAITTKRDVISALAIKSRDGGNKKISLRIPHCV